MFYNKFDANCYEELLRYYPRFYRDVYEMVEILKAQGALADKLESGVEQIVANSFIDTADAATISRLEKFIGIKLQKVGTLEERRRIVKSYFVGAGKASASMLKEMIHAYTNADVDIRFEPADEAGNNKLYIDFDRGSEKDVYVHDIQTLVSAKIPAHINYELNMRYGSSARLRYAAVLQTGTTVTIGTEAIK